MSLLSFILFGLSEDAAALSWSCISSAVGMLRCGEVRVNIASLMARDGGH
jgi:hypothetical protein